MDALAAARPVMPPGIEDRDADVWEPLLVIADAEGGDWPERARAAAVALVGAARDAEPSLGIRLLADLRTIFGDRDALSSKAALRELVALEESPWGDLKGKPLDERGLARRLRQYGVRSKQIRIGDLTLKGYSREDLRDVWERYLPPSPHGSETRETSETDTDFATEFTADTASTLSETSKTSAQPVSDVSDGVSGCFASGNGKNPYKSMTVSDVSDVSLVPGDRGNAPFDDGWLDIPVSCRRCGHCGRPGATIEVALGDRPGTVRLHAECETAWMEKV